VGIFSLSSHSITIIISLLIEWTGVLAHDDGGR
jgi:hypothetical protein